MAKNSWIVGVELEVKYCEVCPHRLRYNYVQGTVLYKCSKTGCFFSQMRRDPTTGECSSRRDVQEVDKQATIAPDTEAPAEETPANDAAPAEETPAEPAKPRRKLKGDKA